MTETAEQTRTLIEPVAYWKLRTRFLGHQLLMKQLQEQEASSKQALDAAMLEAGLEANKPYRLSDADCAAILADG